MMMIAWFSHHALNCRHPMKALFIINDPPYGTEKAYNALRLATAMQKEIEDVEMRIFLMADAVVGAVAAQDTPNGYYNIGRMLKVVLAKGAEVALCGTCMDARGVQLESCVDGATRGSMAQLAQWTAEADRVLVF